MLAQAILAQAILAQAILAQAIWLKHFNTERQPRVRAPLAHQIVTAFVSLTFVILVDCRNFAPQNSWSFRGQQWLPQIVIVLGNPNAAHWGFPHVSRATQPPMSTLSVEQPGFQFPL